MLPATLSSSVTGVVARERARYPPRMTGREGEDDPLERAEHQRALSDFELSRDVKPSRLVGAPRLSMSPIQFASVRPTPIVWCGQEIDVYVLIHRDGRPISAPPPVTWTSSNSAVLSVRDLSPGSGGFARVVGGVPGEAIIVATAAGGARQEISLRVAEEPEIEWF